MLIDWFTLCAQALNFLILVWLMKRFLYKPILDAIATREKRIAVELADADAKKTEAQKERDEFRQKNEEFNRDRAALLAKVTDEANNERQRLLDEARMEAGKAAVKRQETLKNEAHQLNQAISLRTRQEVFSIARRVLTDLAGTSLEARVTEVFTQHLRVLEVKEKSRLADAIKTSSEPALVRSTFDLPAGQRDAIQKAVDETFSADVHLRFEKAPDLISGIELSANGQKVAWSIKNYLASLEKSLDELLKEKDVLEAKSGTGSDLAPQIAKRAYELYEQGGRKTDSEKQDWNRAEREIRKIDSKDAPKTETKPDAKSVSKPKTKNGPKPETGTELKSKTTEEPKTESKLKPKPEEEAEPKPEAKVELKPETLKKSKFEAKPKPEDEAEPKPETKAEAKPKANAASETVKKPEAGSALKPVTTEEPKVEAGTATGPVTKGR